MHLWMHNDTNRDQFARKIIESLTPNEINDLSYMKKVMQEIQGRSYHQDIRFDSRAVKIIDVVGIAKKIEVPVVTGKSVSHRNTIDCILDVTLNCEAVSKEYHQTWENSKKTFQQFHIYILCEFKPKLDEVSAYLGQIHLYVKRLEHMYDRPFNDATIIPVLITLDDVRDFDKLFMDDGIRLFRLAWDANTNTVVNLPEPPNVSNLEDLFWSDKAKAAAK